MTKECAVCGKEFIAKTNRAKYCCKECANHSRFNKTLNEIRQEKEELKKIIQELYDTGLNDVQIAAKTGKGITYIQKTRSEMGLLKQYTALQRQVMKFRQEGLCSVEISEKLGIGAKQIRALAERVGMPFTKEEKRRSTELAKKKSIIAQYGKVEERIEHCRKYVESRYPGLEYISDWVSGSEKIKLRCKDCGNEFEKSAITIRADGNTPCPHCIEKAREEKKNQNRLLRIEERKQKEAKKIKRFWEQSFEQTAVSFCPVCNSVFYGKRKYCSDECRKRAVNSTHKDKRIRKLRDRQIDKDITLKALFDRDKGKCWICGDICDFEDFTRNEDGKFIVGANYPSIDHVFPLSKGGLHSWDNVKLAHHYCNTLKSNKVVSL